jgi:ubiquinone/menaquinone biosynthesis C-methylase UbiE
MKPSHFILSPGIVDTYDKFCSSQIGYISALNQLSIVLKAHITQDQLLSCTVLEIGSGTGECTQRILESLPSVEITAIDNDVSLQKKAREKSYSRFRHSSVEFQLSDALGFLTEAVQSQRLWDFVVAGFTLHNWECAYRSKVLQNIFQIIRPGGWFVMVDYFPENHAEAIDAFTKHITWLQTTSNSSVNADLRSFWVTHTLEDMNPKRLMYEQSAISELKQLGFSLVESHRITKLEAVVSTRKIAARSQPSS